MPRLSILVILLSTPFFSAVQPPKKPAPPPPLSSRAVIAFQTKAGKPLPSEALSNLENPPAVRNMLAGKPAAPAGKK